MIDIYSVKNFFHSAGLIKEASLRPLEKYLPASVNVNCAVAHCSSTWHPSLHPISLYLLNVYIIVYEKWSYIINVKVCCNSPL